MCPPTSHVHHDVCICAYRCAGVHGPDGGTWYMYTQKHTDQEKWSVNHITYIVVYTEHGSTKRGIIGTIFLFYLWGVDMPH